MTLDDLCDAFGQASGAEYDRWLNDRTMRGTGPALLMRRAGIAAVVRALRGKIGEAHCAGQHYQIGEADTAEANKWSLKVINEILGSEAGNEKAAGGPTPDNGRPLVEGADKETSQPAAPAADRFDFEAHLAHQAAWSEKTFGPGRSTARIIDHIRKEIAEVEADPEDATEWLDIATLALDGALRAGMRPQKVIEGLVVQRVENLMRSWPDWRTADPNKAIEHDRSKDAADPKVCVWMQYLNSRTLFYPQCESRPDAVPVSVTPFSRAKHCPLCGLPIKFQEQQS